MELYHSLKTYQMKVLKDSSSQMEIVSIIDAEDAGQIQAKVKECIEKDPRSN